jgi:hypothetical protein
MAARRSRRRLMRHICGIEYGSVPVFALLQGRKNTLADTAAMQHMHSVQRGRMASLFFFMSALQDAVRF